MKDLLTITYLLKITSNMLHKLTVITYSITSLLKKHTEYENN